MRSRSRDRQATHLAADLDQRHLCAGFGKLLGDDSSRRPRTHYADIKHVVHDSASSVLRSLRVKQQPAGANPHGSRELGFVFRMRATWEVCQGRVALVLEVLMDSDRGGVIAVDRGAFRRHKESFLRLSRILFV